MAPHMKTATCKKNNIQLSLFGHHACEVKHGTHFSVWFALDAIFGFAINHKQRLNRDYRITAPPPPYLINTHVQQTSDVPLTAFFSQRFTVVHTQTDYSLYS
jgi:hypothetical protein